MEISAQQVRHVAALARLYLSDADVERLARDMGNVLAMAGTLLALDTEGVEPMTHAVAITNVLREDEAQPSFAREAILQNAAGQDGEAFTVPQVVE